MKKIIAVIVISFLIISGFGAFGANLKTKNNTFIESAQNNNLVFSLSFPSIEELRFLNKNGFQRIEIDSFSYLTNIGKPMLPVKNFIFALPPSARVRSVDFQFDKLTELPGFYNIEPAPIIIPIDNSQNLYEKVQEEWIENNQITYYSDQVFPPENGKITNTGTIRKYPYVSLSVCPFQYFPLSGVIKYHESVKITITYDHSESNDNLKSDTIADEKASELFYNYDQIKDMYEPINPRSSMLDEYDYLIITSDDLVGTVQSSDFLNWKTTIGYNTKIVLVTDYEITSQPGVDLAEQIRNFLREYYISWGVEYVLIVGDYTTVPMRYCSPNPNNLYGTVPTDIYYADLSYSDSESWNSNGDNFYGVYEQDNPDFLAEVYVGRIPTSDISRLAYTLDKIVTFEQDTGGWKNNVLHGGAMLFYANEDHDPIIDHDIDGCSALDAIEKDFMNGWTTCHYCEHEGLSPSVYPFDPLTEQAYTADWRNNQHAVVNWAAHGAPSSIGRVIWSWDDGDGIPEHENGELTWGRFLDTYSNLEGDYPSIVFAVSCNVGHPEPDPDGNLGIDLLTKESFGAAVAICSATRGAAVSVNWTETHAGAEALCYEFNHYMINGPNGPSKLGEALYDSKFYVHNNFGWDHYLEFQNMYDYNLYGDPAMMREGITPGAPSKPDINGPINGKPGVEYDYNFMSIHPLDEDIFYFINWGDGNIQNWTGPYASGEVVTFNHTFTTKGTFTISARAKDIYNAQSAWGNLDVTMPRSRFLNNFIMDQILEFFQIILSLKENI
jgi:hypothetical protein